jgi:hypothetical protein
MPAVIRAKSWPSRSTSPTTVTPSARKAAASPAPGNPAPRQTGGSNDPRTPREQPKAALRGKRESVGEGARGLRAAQTSEVVAAGWPQLRAPEASASPPCRPEVGGRSGPVAVCNHDGPTNLTTARPPASGLGHPPTAHRRRRDDRRRGRRPAARTAIDRRGLGATRHRPVEEGGPAAALHPGKDRGPAARR